MAILSILTLPFLGLFTFLNRVSVVGSHLYRSGIAAQNYLESLSGKSLLELYTLAASDTTEDSEYHYSITWLGFSESASGIFPYQFFFRQEETHIAGYLFCPDLSPPIIFSSSVEPLHISMEMEETGVRFRMLGDHSVLDTFIPDSNDFYLNVYLQDKPNDVPVAFSFTSFDTRNMKITFYDNCFDRQEVLVSVNEDSYRLQNRYLGSHAQTLPFTYNPLWMTLEADLRMRVDVFERANPTQLLNSRTGVIHFNP